MGVAQTVEREYHHAAKNYYYDLDKRKLRRGYLSDGGGQWIADIVVHLYKFVDFKQIFTLNRINKAFRLGLEHEDVWRNPRWADIGRMGYEGYVKSRRAKYLYWQPVLRLSDCHDNKKSDSFLAQQIHRWWQSEGFYVMKVESDLLVRLSKVQKEFWEKRDKFRSHFGDDAHTCETYREYFHVPSADVEKKFPGHSVFKEWRESLSVLKEYQELCQEISHMTLRLLSKHYLEEMMQVLEWPYTHLGEGKGINHSFLRFICYAGCPEHRVSPHTDLSLLAIVPCSNRGQGFTIFPNDPLSHHKYEIDLEILLEADDLIVFPGMLMNHLTMGVYTPLSHTIKFQSSERHNVLFQQRADPEVKLSVEIENYVTNYYKGSLVTGQESETAYKEIIPNPNIERIEKAKTVGMVVGHILTLGIPYAISKAREASDDRILNPLYVGGNNHENMEPLYHHQ